MRETKVGEFEYRVHCARHREEGHRAHVYKAKATGADLVGSLNANRFHRDCSPWVFEARFVTEWTDDIDGLETRSLRLYGQPHLFDGADT